LDIFSWPRLLPFGAGRFVLQQAGQPGVPCVPQNSSNLCNWTSVATDILTGNVLSITNTMASGTGGQFWRATWLP
jgi:hypothetical protein